jgi:hypothetical protein
MFKQLANKAIYTVGHAFFLLLGWADYRFRGRNSTRSQQAMIYFFCASGGRFNQWCSEWISRWHKPLPLFSKTGILGDMSSEAGSAALTQLREKGYVSFSGALPVAACDRLMQYALNTPATVRPMDGEEKSCTPKLALYNSQQPLAVRYDYAPSSLLAQPDVQTLMADPSLLALAESYLQARPRFDVLSMWWHTAFHTRPDSEAAQFYHFDLDRLKWLKIFVYLTDVGPQDGPHSFIESSHQSGGIPQHFLNRGYVRLSDNEVLGHYGVAREVRFAAPRGTIIVEDTRGLHKGNPVSGTARLVLQLQLSNSLFGADYPKATIPQERVSALQALIDRAADVYKAYL